MKIEQFVMAYQVEQDRIRAMLPKGFESLRPVMRINTEIRDETTVYIEFNTPVEHDGIRGWLNIAHWESPEEGFSYRREGKTVQIVSPFLKLTYSAIGLEGGCPAEGDNEGCFFLGEDPGFRANKVITNNKEFCDCEFEWDFNGKGAHGVSQGKTLPAHYEKQTTQYPQMELSAENAALIPCRQVLGTYIVSFER